jgi:hypothetical protein
LSLTSGTLWHLIHLPSPLWACLDEKVEDGRCVARGLRRWGEWGTNGSNESERSSDDDDDDDTVGALRGKRHFEETCAFGHRVNSRCASTDRVVSTQPVSERCLVVAGSHPSTATLSKCLHGTVATWDQSRRGNCCVGTRRELERTRMAQVGRAAPAFCVTRVGHRQA